jgi:surface antigen
MKPKSYPISIYLLLFLSLPFLAACQTPPNGDHPGANGTSQATVTLGDLFRAAVGDQFVTDAAHTLSSLLGADLARFLSLDDQNQVAQAGADALNGTATGSTTTWTNPATGARATLTAGNTRLQQQSLTIARNSNVAPPPPLDLIAQPYAAKAATRIKLAPTTGASEAGTLKSGGTIMVIGKLRDLPWYLVGVNNRAVGYIQTTLLAPAPAPTRQAFLASTNTAPATKTPANPKPSSSPQPSSRPERSAEPTSAKRSSTTFAPAATPASDTPQATQSPATRTAQRSSPSQPSPSTASETGIDLDATDAATPAVIDKIDATVECRDLTASVTTSSATGSPTTTTRTACKAADGAWQL